MAKGRVRKDYWVENKKRRGNKGIPWDWRARCKKGRELYQVSPPRSSSKDGGVKSWPH